MSKLKVGAIGCGFISGAHLKGWKNIEHVEVSAVCDIDKNRAEKRAKEFEVNKIYTDYQEMLDKETLDIVDVITPVYAHKDIILDCADKHVHILTEKPFADTLEDAREMVMACEKNGCRLMVCHTNRWHPWFVQIKKELENGTIGRPYYGNITQRVSFAIPMGKEGKIALFEDQPFYKNIKKLLLLEQGCHYIDIFRYFFGEAVSVTASVNHVSPYVNGDDMALVIMRFSDTVATLEDLWCTVGQEKTSVTFVQGEKGSLYFGGTGGAAPHRTVEVEGLQVNLSDGTTTVKELEGKDYYVRSFEKVERHFVECLLTDKEPMTSGKDNLKTLEIAFKAYKASELQRTVFIGEN